MAEAKHSNRTLTGILIFVVVVATTLSGATFVLYQQHQSALSDAQKALRHANLAIQEGRRADYRLCVRQMVNRAVIDNIRDKDGDDRITHLPLYDCTPDLVGDPARRLSKRESDELRATVAHMPVSRLP